ncbi:hypothetical protein Y032_0029g1949 [Ancylostoma ceylanicum]|uniref:Uncharacterized protein n=1 Tax=Ancylostoma ceylanicum TaxID=53326 RepID=A0A016USU4_9BILA|nr:hypothetical protein Y032_0029g1949 [Ancylostoma ceylanicum]
MGTTWFTVVLIIACTLGVDAHYDGGYGAGRSSTSSEQRRLIYLPKPDNFILDSLLKYPRSNVKYPIYLAKQTNNYGQETGTVLGLLLPVRSLGEEYQKAQTSQSSYSTKPCTIPSGAASLFLEASEQLVEDYTDGARTPLPNSCPPCAGGSQLSYAPINPRNDISEMRAGVITNFVPGGFRCKDNENLCVHGTDGSKYKAASKNTVIWPVPYCRGESCTMLLTLDPTEAVKEYHGGKLERGTDQLKDRERVIYYNGNEYNYIEMNAITCGGCRTDANICHPTSMGTKYGSIHNSAKPDTDSCLEETGYRYDGGQQLPADTYGNMEVSATEEPYSALGYGDNTQYIQPDGINPYDESSDGYSPPSTDAGDDGYEQPSDDTVSQPQSDTVLQRLRAANQRLNAANRRLVRTRANIRNLRTQVAVQRTRANTAIQVAKVVGRPTVNVRPANVNVKVNANPNITNQNNNNLSSAQASNQNAAVGAPKMQSPVIEDEHFLNTADLKDPSQELVSMISQLSVNPRFHEAATLRIAHPNMVWEVRRNKTSSQAETANQAAPLGENTTDGNTLGSTSSAKVATGNEPDRINSILKESEESTSRGGAEKSADDTSATDLKAKEAGPPGQQPSLQWISSHLTTDRPLLPQ